MIELARLQVELLELGATMQGPALSTWYTGGGKFHSHRVLRPNNSPEPLISVTQDGVIVLQPCAMINLMPIGEMAIGVASGLWDHLLLVDPVHKVLGGALDQIVHVAREHAPPTARDRRIVVWIAPMEVDEE